MKNLEEYTMTDETIAQIAKILQVAILTGTDIVDNLRLAKFVVTDGSLVVSPKYAKEFNDNLENMLAAVQSNKSTTEEVSGDLTSGVFES